MRLALKARKKTGHRYVGMARPVWASPQ